MSRRKGCPHSLSRRDFLGLSAAGMLGAAAPIPALAKGSRLPQARPKVAIAHSSHYSPWLIRRRMETLLDNIGGLGDVIRPGDKVGIKVNLVNGTLYEGPDHTPPAESHQIHPEVVRTLAELIRDAGAGHIDILEAPPDPADFHKLGFDAISKPVGARLIDLNSPAPYEDFATVSAGDRAFVYEDFLFNPLLPDYDVLVSATKMKCHYNAGVTLSMKNLIGLVPVQHYSLQASDFWRSAIHGPDWQTPTRLPGTILDLNHARPIALSVIDGIKTGEGGEGPWWDSFNLIEPHVLIAGKNPVATDAVATAVMGFDPTTQAFEPPFLRGFNYLNVAAQFGLGTNRLDEIEVVGLAIEDVMKPFKPATGRNGES